MSNRLGAATIAVTILAYVFGPAPVMCCMMGLGCLVAWNGRSVEECGTLPPHDH